MSRSDMIVELLGDFGFEPERFNLTWVSSAEPDKFVAAVKEMTDTIRKLGPLNNQDAAVA